MESKSGGIHSEYITSPPSPSLAVSATWTIREASSWTLLHTPVLPQPHGSPQCSCSCRHAENQTQSLCRGQLASRHTLDFFAHLVSSFHCPLSHPFQQHWPPCYPLITSSCFSGLLHLLFQAPDASSPSFPNNLLHPLFWRGFPRLPHPKKLSTHQPALLFF